MNGNAAYVGPTIGELLTRAKREYIKNSGPGTFSVYDEKVIEELTLYGLPFIRVKVPNPYLPPFAGNAFDPQPQPVPPAQQNNAGTITRIITFTNTFKAEPFSFGQVPRVSSLVRDSFAPGLRPCSRASIRWRSAGAVLPTLSYDITLRPTTSPGTGTGIPQPRGVRLLSAITLSDISNFNPSVTSVISDQIAPKPSDPALTTIEQWLPDQPYTFQRTGFDTTPADKLVVTPVQFRAVDTGKGWLRRFGQMVFEITYVDPRRAPANILADTTPPLVSNIIITPLAARSIRHRRRTIGRRERDRERQRRQQRPDRCDGVLYDRRRALEERRADQGQRKRLPGHISRLSSNRPDVVAIIQARDSAGNVSVQSLKGTLSDAFSTVHLPTIRR